MAETIGVKYGSLNISAIIKFSQKQKESILDINEIYGISHKNLYKVELYFEFPVNDENTKRFLYENGFRVNGHHIIEKNGNNYQLIKYDDSITNPNVDNHISDVYVNFCIYPYKKNIDAIYTLSFDKFDITDNFTPLDFLITVICYKNETSDKTTKYIKANIVSEAIKNIDFYDSQANTIGSDMDSFMLIRTNPKLTGNIKLVVTDDYHLYLDTFKVSSVSILNERKYRRQSVAANGNYAHDVKAIFSDIPKGILYNVHSDAYLPHKNYYDINIQVENTYEYGVENNFDSLYSENMKILAPLHIGKKLPDYFCIFRTDNIINSETYNGAIVKDIDKFTSALKNPYIVKIFDLRTPTSIGQYLHNYAEILNSEIQGGCHLLFIEQNYDKRDANYRQGRNTWYGIDINKGIITKKVETTYFGTKILEDEYLRQEKFNKFVLDGYERNNLLYPNIINLEFMFNDNDADNMSMHNYFGLYLTENQFVKFNSITLSSDVNAITTYFDANDNIVDQRNINFDIVEKPEYDDRIFFMSTASDVQYINSKQDINTFIKKYANNIPGKNICNLKCNRVDFSDINSFIVMKFTHQIQYGEHFKFVFMKNDVSTVFEIIASNDHRLRYTKDNINPYISTNTPDDVTKDINIYTQIYRLSFYTQDLSDPDKTASLGEQLKRIRACIRKFDGSNMYVGDVNDDTISFFATYNEDDVIYNDIYFQHILIDNTEEDYVRYYNYNNTVNTYVYIDSEKTYNVIEENNDLYPDNLIGFSNNGLELTKKRYYTITKFINTNELKNNFVYDIEHEMYKDLKNIISPIVNTVRGYYPLLKFDILNTYIKYKTPSEVYRVNLNTGVVTTLNYKEEMGILQDIKEYTILSPFNVSSYIVISPFKARLINSFINICQPKTAALSLMGINNINDIDTWVNNEEKISYSSAKSISIKKGEKLYIYKDIKPYITYKLLSGHIKNIPMGNNVSFVIYNDMIVYTYNGEIYTMEISADSNYLIADEDTELSLYDMSFLDEYNYESIIKEMNIDNYYKSPANKDLSDLIIPIVPTINCNWKSNGLYFDHNSILNTDYLTTAYGGNLNDFSEDNSIVGHFTENVYMPGYSNNNQYINIFLDDYNSQQNLYKDFLLNNITVYDTSSNNTHTQYYKYPLKKYLIQNLNLETATGYYNKYTKTLEFIYYGIKFNINLNNNEYSRDIKLEEYNNYQIFIINSYDGSNINEIFISKAESFILIINHAYHINLPSTNDGVVTLENMVQPATYNWYKAPYNYDMSNCAKIEDTYIFMKSNSQLLKPYENSEVYFIENDLDVYDLNFNLVYNEQPYYSYIKIDDESFESYTNNDRIKHIYEGDDKQPTIMSLMTPDPKYMNYYNVSPLNDIYDDTAYITEIVYVDDEDTHGNPILRPTYQSRVTNDIELRNTLHGFFNEYDINFRQKNSYILKTNKNKIKLSYKNKLAEYIKSFDNKDILLHIIYEDKPSQTLLINSNYRPIIISMDILHTKYNHGIFNPSFKKIFEFDTNDDISKVINMDCLLANTHVKAINPIKNYTYNKIVKTGNHLNTNYFMIPTKEMFTSSWDNNIYRLYSNDNNYETMSGYITGIEDKMLFGSKCIIIHDNTLDITKYDYDRSNVTENVILSKFNENTNALNTYNIVINLSKVFYNNIINTKAFYDNWTLNIKDLSKASYAMNNFILNTLSKFFNLNDNFTLKMYRKYDINKRDTDNIFVYDKPEDFDQYEEYMNFTTEYKISDNDVFITINIPDYVNYYYYLIIKINRY